MDHDCPETDTQAARRLWLAPDWTRPETWLSALARYIAHAPTDGSVCLCLEIGAADAALATDLVAIACETLADAREFAEVLLVAEAVDHREVVRVHGAADVLAALGAYAPAPAGDAGQIVARARRGKALADELRTIADHHTMTLGGDPWLDPAPLVTVQIPTWKGHGRLVARTIPSVLEGTYRNVEVLVCSDGPDPAARAAVEQIAGRDARVRYLELPERPNHPSHPWSAWETADVHAANHALDGARGRSAPLGHDDEFTATHIADLLARARQERADLVHGQALSGGAPGRRRSSAARGSAPARSATARSCTPTGLPTCATTRPAGCWRSPATGTCGGAWSSSAPASRAWIASSCCTPRATTTPLVRHRAHGGGPRPRRARHGCGVVSRHRVAFFEETAEARA